MTIAGTASPYWDGTPGTETELNAHSKERIAVGAWETLIDSRPKVIATFNHNENALLGSTDDGSLRLWHDRKGLHYELDLPETTTGRDVYTLVKSKRLRGSSFHAKLGRSTWTREGNFEVRTVHEITAIKELGPVTIPHYRGGSNLAVRGWSLRGMSVQEYSMEDLDKERDEYYETQRRIAEARAFKL